MNKAYLKIFFILFLASVGVLIFSSILEKGQEKFHNHKFKRIHEIFAGDKPYDILYIGSSRIHVSINPCIVDSITYLNSFNAGVEGGTMYEFKMTFDGYLIHHPPPRILVLGIDAQSFDVKRNIFYPPQYYEELNNPVVYSSIGSKYESFLLKNLPVCRLIYYDDFTKTTAALSGLAGRNEMQPLRSFECRGFLSNGNVCIDSITGNSYPTLQVEFQENAIKSLQAIIDCCKRKNICLLLMYTPEYKFKYQQTITNFSAFRYLLDSMASMNNVLVFHDDSLSLCNNACYFANFAHLNTQGAYVYSVVIANRMNNQIYLNGLNKPSPAH